MHPIDDLSLTFAALADPTRRAILSRLAQGEASVKELARPFRMSAPAVSKHLKVLERSGLISRGRSAQWRPCRIKAEPMKDAVNWLEHYRRFLAFRRANPALAKGDIDFLAADNDVVVFVRELGNEQVICAFNLGARTAALDLGAETTLESIEGHGFTGSVTGGKIALGPYGAWFGRMG